MLEFSLVLPLHHYFAVLPFVYYLTSVSAVFLCSLVDQVICDMK